MEQKIIDILNKHKDVCLEFGGENTAIDEENFGIIAQEIVKLFAIPDVIYHVCPECKGAGYHFFINQGEPDVDSICKKCNGSGQIVL